jgi:hypothetical protein
MTLAQLDFHRSFAERDNDRVDSGTAAVEELQARADSESENLDQVSVRRLIERGTCALQFLGRNIEPDHRAAP